MADRFGPGSWAEAIDPAGWYAVGRDDTRGPYRVLHRIVRYGPWGSDADLARALDLAAPRALPYVRSAHGREILAGMEALWVTQP